MEVSLQELAKKNLGLGKQFDAALAEKAPLSSACAVLKQFRAAFEDLALRDICCAQFRDLEERVWVAHSRVNGGYRKQLSQLRKESSSKPVETRKFMKEYLEFLKDSQRFYREYIQKLNATYGAIPELQQIAQLAAPNSSLDAPQDTSSRPREETLQSCHRTLIYLGDLSRYRTTEKLDKEPSWGPATGYYNLASTLRPSSGLAFHQQSVIAFAEGDHLRAVYYLYRAILVDEPHPNASQNLDLEFQKVQKAWDSGKLIPRSSPQDPHGSRKIMVAWFVRLHSLCYYGKHFKGHDELENEVLNQLSMQMSTPGFEATLSKICFTNFAAQATAGIRLEDNPNSIEACLFFFRLNVKTFTNLLQVCCLSLPKDPHAGKSTAGPVLDASIATRLTSIMRCALPALRLYSTWLLSNSRFFATASLTCKKFPTEVSRFFTTYAETLTLFSKLFPVTRLPEIVYQLEEDVEAASFKPLESSFTDKIWKLGHGNRPKFSEVGEQRLGQDQELLGRIRDLLQDGLLVVKFDQNIPLTFTHGTFVYDETSSANPSISPTDTEAHVPARNSRAAPEAEAQRPDFDNPTAPVDPEVARMSQMVDDLVGPDMDHPLPNGNAAIVQKADGREQDRRPSSAQSLQRLQSVSGLWPNSPHAPPRTPSVDATTWIARTPQSAIGQAKQAHSRVGSASSIRSANSVQTSAIPSSFVPTPPMPPTSVAQFRGTMDSRPSGGLGNGLASYDSSLQSPLLFGSGGPWSTLPRQSVSSYTPPNGQGG